MVDATRGSEACPKGDPKAAFPPRLEVVVKEQNPNGFPSHPRD